MVCCWSLIKDYIEAVISNETGCKGVMSGSKTMMMGHPIKVMVSRMSLILWALEAKKVLWLYEQPSTSLLFQHPRMQHFIKHRTVFKCHMWMGAFGADTPKGTHLWAPDACVSKFSLPLPNDKELVTKKVLPDGGAQATGNSALKGNQSYPPAFGHATVGVWKLATKRLQPLVNASLPNVWASRHDKWSDADLAEVFQFLSLGTM